jgi:exonuclease SbcD
VSERPIIKKEVIETMFKFIHAADIHLDSPLRGLSAYEGAPVEALRGATREAFVRMVDFAIEEGVHFVLIAGDLYDGKWNDVNTGLFFAKQMGRLDRVDIQVFIIVGNHDFENKITKQIAWPENVVVIGSRKAETHCIAALKVAIHGQSFASKDETSNLAAGYPDPVEGYYNIGILHTALDGREGHNPYAPCSATELQNFGYDYWALGHVHTYEVVSESPYIVFPGNIQGRHVKEPGEKGGVLVTVQDGKSVLERVPFDVLRWHVLPVDASSCESLQAVISDITAGLKNLLAMGDSLPKAVRVLIQGASPAHAALKDQASRLRSEVLHAAVAMSEDLWIEKVKISTTPAQDKNALILQGDALGELAGVFERALKDEDFMAAFGKDLDDIARKLPAQLSDEVELLGAGEHEAFIRNEMDTLIAQLAHMQTGEGAA